MVHTGTRRRIRSLHPAPIRPQAFPFSRELLNSARVRLEESTTKPTRQLLLFHTFLVSRLNFPAESGEKKGGAPTDENFSWKSLSSRPLHPVRGKQRKWRNRVCKLVPLPFFFHLLPWITANLPLSTSFDKTPTFLFFFFFLSRDFFRLRETPTNCQFITIIARYREKLISSSWTWKFRF